MKDSPARLLDRYELDALLATGGMAEVWAATDEVLARLVAVKILLPKLARDPVLVERFRREAFAAARLEHPNIISIYDTGTDTRSEEARHFIVMEHCLGGSLLAALKEQGPMSPGQVTTIGSTICEALAHAHSQGVIHRDVKPANVLITDQGILKVSDFGIAKVAFSATDLTNTGSTVGTATYFAPELASGRPADARSDLYSLGVLLYELLVGRPPFREATEVATAISHVKRPPPAPRAVRAGIPREVEEVIMRALAKDPDDRYQTAADMKRALDAEGADSETQAFARPRLTGPAAYTDQPQASTPGGFIRSEGKGVARVVALVVVAVIAAVIVGSIARKAGDPGPRSGDQASGASEPLAATVTDFDPYAGDGEHPAEAPLARDGDLATFWRTSDYKDPLSVVKPGVGLLFDLGESQQVTEVQVVLDAPGYSFELRASDSLGTTEEGFDLLDQADPSAATEVMSPNVTARYWLVWLKDFPTGPGRGRIAEVTFSGG